MAIIQALLNLASINSNPLVILSQQLYSTTLDSETVLIKSVHTTSLRLIVVSQRSESQNESRDMRHNNSWRGMNGAPEMYSSFLQTPDQHNTTPTNHN